MKNDSYELWYIPTKPERTMATDRRGLLQCQGDVEDCHYPPGGRLMAVRTGKPAPRNGAKVPRSHAKVAFGKRYVADRLQRTMATDQLHTPPCPDHILEAVQRFVQAARNSAATPQVWTIGENGQDHLHGAGWRVRVDPTAPQYPYTYPRSAKIHFQAPGTERLIEIKALSGTEPQVWYTTRTKMLWERTNIYVRDLRQAVAHVCNHTNGHRPPPVPLTLLTAVAGLLEPRQHGKSQHHQLTVTPYRGGQAGTPRQRTLTTLGQLVQTVGDSIDSARGGVKHHWVVDVDDPAGGIRQIRTVEYQDEWTILLEPNGNGPGGNDRRQATARALRDLLDTTIPNRNRHHNEWKNDSPIERVTDLITLSA